MKNSFESLMERISPVLKRISRTLNGHFGYFDDNDLYQEALVHMWPLFQQGKLDDKTDSYILQGCYFHLKNYLRKAQDKAMLTSLNKVIDEGGCTLEDILPYSGPAPTGDLDIKLFIETAKAKGMTQRELDILLFLLEGLTVREIGTLLSISHVMVVKLRKRIKVKCKDFLYENR